ncbi:replicative dna helicase [Streptomyces xiamenensis]|uniref:Replicative DNA helicase n=2 Tax=Streptomyces xiamenensis TaxID=408015 RepID=A0A0F7FUK2_9ACTN|nr:replicative DNA helicase [Streptomyces xiamenensis]AKG44037.1 replicative dna helicase [Streptomyces xiamenensis]
MADFEHGEPPWDDAASGDGPPPARGGPGAGQGHGSGPDDGASSTAFERVPPQDVRAEQSVLGGMLLSKDAIADVVETLRGADFYKPAHETIYAAILDLYAKGEPADPITVANELTKRGELAKVGGAGYVHSIVQMVPTAANALYYAEIVHDKAVLRRLVQAGTRITQMGYAADGDVDDIVNTAQAEVYQVTEQRTSEDYLPLSDIMEGALDEIEAIGARSGEMTGVPTGFTDLDSLTNGLHPGQMIVIAARPAMGKALALDTPLPTPTGWTTMGEVRPGDHLLDASGRPTRVVEATEVMTGRPCYEVSFDDGTTVIADADHQWLTDTRASRRSAHVPAAVRTTKEIAETLHCLTADGRHNHTVRNTAPLDLPQRDLPIPPYVLGAWLGDGHSAAARITSADAELVRRIADEGFDVRRVGSSITYALRFAVHAPEPVERTCVVCGKPYAPKLAHVRTCGRSCGGKARFVSDPQPRTTCVDCGETCFSASPEPRCASCHRRHGSLLVQLRELGVLGDKHIPLSYLRGSVAQRRALLAGLLDTDGTVTNTGSVQFAVVSRRLAEGFRELVVGLGYRCGVRTKAVNGRSVGSSTAYVITFTPTDEVFALGRKRRMHAERRRPGTAKLGQRVITAVREVASVPVRCVQVDNPDHLYLATRSMVPTHNSTLALDFARACSIKHKLPSVIFSLEMGRNEIAMRLLSAEARVALHHMRSGSMTDEDWTRVARQMTEVNDAPLYIDDSPNLSMMEIRAKCRRLKQRNDLRLVVIDYLQLMQSGGSRRPESRQQEVSEMSRNLKLLAKELEVPVIALSQLNRGPEQRTDKKPMVSDLRESGCVTAETRILRADTGAEVTIAELMESGERGFPVWSLDEQLRLVRRPMTHVFSSGVKEVFRLTLASGREIDATANHPFLMYDGWRPLGELSPGSRIAVPRGTGVPQHTREWPEAELIMLAHLIGDGCVAPRQPVHYTSNDEANLTAVKEAAAHFGITPRLVRQDSWWHLYLPSPHPTGRGRRNPIAEWLDGFGLYGKRSHEKFLPGGIFALPDEQLRLFLRHLWATDGSVTVSRSGAVRVYYATTSERLARDLQLLLLRLDIRARLRSVTGSPGRPGWTLDISGVEDQRRFLERVGVHGARARHVVTAAERLRNVRMNTNIDTVPNEVWGTVRALMGVEHMSTRAFQSALGVRYNGSALYRSAPSRGRLGRVAEVLRAEDLELLATSDVFWDEVVSVRSLGEREVFDATVPGTHNFVANGINIHNSIEQDADMVILLHREDAYEKESPRAGEADLIVAKHRNGPTATITVAFQGHYSRFVNMEGGF